MKNTYKYGLTGVVLFGRFEIEKKDWIMASLSMGKAHPLNVNEINARVSKKIGNYALGRMKDKTFIVEYVGRSDTDLNDRLKDWVGKYPKFKFSHEATRLAAWKKECKNYHDFGGSDKLGNDIHPARPDGYSKKDNPCPVSGCNE